MEDFKRRNEMSNNKRPFLHYIGMTESGVPAKNRGVNYEAKKRWNDS